MIAVGIDTHKHTHTAVAANQLGEVLAGTQIETTSSGYARFLKWLAQFEVAPQIGIEGAASFGAGLCRVLQEAGFEVFEVERPSRFDRARGKSDQIDALAAAKRVLTGKGLSLPRSCQARRALAALLVAYRSSVDERARLRCQIQSLAMTSSPQLRERIGKGDGRKLEAKVARMRSAKDAGQDEEAALYVMRMLAKRAIELGKQKRLLEAKLKELICELDPGLLDEQGVGPFCAAQLLISDPQRFSSEAAFAMASGTAPLEASSGMTVRHRLSRRGDRQLNRAIHTIALSRSLHHEPSRAYLERRMSEGKTRKEAMRALKRHISRRAYKRICGQALTL